MHLRAPGTALELGLAGLGARITCPLLSQLGTLGHGSPHRTLPGSSTSNTAEQATLPVRLDLFSQVDCQHLPQHCRPRSESWQKESDGLPWKQRPPGHHSPVFCDSLTWRSRGSWATSVSGGCVGSVP